MKFKAVSGVMLTLLVISTSTLAFTIQQARAGDTWTIATVDSAGYVGWFTSIALDIGDKPHISYYDYTNRDLKYAYYDGVTWHNETVDSAGWVGEYTSIALDSGDNPHISYHDETNFDLKYAYYDGINWHKAMVDDIGATGSYTSIALDSGDKPHISYLDETNNALKYAYYDGISWPRGWNITTVDSAGWVGEYTSIALDSGDNPHISYHDETNFDLKYAYYDGVTWHNETVDSAGTVGYYTSIALDSLDRPHISYYDYTNGDLKYAYYDGVNWNIAMVDSAGDVGWFTSITLDSGDKPHISYHDPVNYYLKYAYYDGVTWHNEAVDSAGWVGLFSSIALDGGDKPHISYLDYTNMDLKYARFGQPTSVHDVCVTAVTPHKTIVCQGYSCRINVTVTNEANFTETFNVTAYANTTAIQTLNVTDLPPGNRTITFVWNTTGWDKGTYTISANATTVPGETDTLDNMCIDGTVRVNMVGDVAPEYGLVDIVDIVYVAINFGTQPGIPPFPGQQPYNPNADINDDGIIDIVDIVIVAIHFGETDP